MTDPIASELKAHQSVPKGCRGRLPIAAAVLLAATLTCGIAGCAAGPAPSGADLGAGVVVETPETPEPAAPLADDDAPPPEAATSPTEAGTTPGQGDNPQPPVGNPPPEGEAPPPDGAQQPDGAAPPAGNPPAPKGEDPPAPPPEAGGPASAGGIDGTKALAIALARAGLTADQVDLISKERDHEHGRTVYEIEFVHGSTEYSFEIDAETGEILEEDHDIENLEVHGD